MEHYQSRSCPEAAELLKEEIITYSVLAKILQGECAHIFTDHQNMIVCHSGKPYPVWVWCKNAENEKTISEIARCIKEKLPLEQGYTHILSYDLLEKLREKDDYFRNAREKMGLLSYRLDAIHEVNYPCEGYMSLAREEEIPALIDVWHDMTMEMEGMDLPRERCETSIRNHVSNRGLFAWRVDGGKIAAITARGDQGEFSKISAVYTLPEHRRRGYAINLVHGVTKAMLDDGFTPILYTDAGYAASNACYQKIGYRQIGRLTSICK